MTHRSVILLLTIVTVLGMPLVTASASGTIPMDGTPTNTGTVASDKDVPTPMVASPNGSASIQLACWTTFVPPAPQGGAMTHHYKNCNGYTITVTTGYQNTSGQITAYGGSNVRTVPAQGEVSWYYGATQQNVNYHTIIVR